MKALRREFPGVPIVADLKTMAASYGFDIGKPAANAREAVQWTYFGYLGAIKEMNGAAMSVGRISTFLDIYIERDLAETTLTEAEAQALVDQPDHDLVADQPVDQTIETLRVLAGAFPAGEALARRRAAEQDT